MKKLMLGLTVVGFILFTGCGSKDKSESKKLYTINTNVKQYMSDVKFNEILNNGNYYYMKQVTQNATLTVDQQVKLNEILSKLKKAEVKKELKKELNSGEWSHKYFVDSFGDKTKDDYISEEFKNGRFSNTATSNSTLQGSILITKNVFRFDLYEYGYNGRSKEKFIEGGLVSFKNSNGEVITSTIDKNVSVTRWDNDYEWNRINSFF